MALNKIFVTLMLCGSIMGCSKKNPDKVEDTRAYITGSCAEILDEKHTQRHEFWLKFVEKKYPVNNPETFVALHQILENLEGDPELGELVRLIGEKYKHEPPLGIKDIRTWSIQQMQKNLTEILYKAVKQNNETGKQLLQGMRYNCSRQTI